MDSLCETATIRVLQQRPSVTAYCGVQLVNEGLLLSREFSMCLKVAKGAAFAHAAGLGGLNDKGKKVPLTLPEGGLPALRQRFTPPRAL